MVCFETVAIDAPSKLLTLRLLQLIPSTHGCVSCAVGWQGVRFETVAIDASPEFLEMYNAAVDVWQDTRQFMDAHCPGSSRLVSTKSPTAMLWRNFMLQGHTWCAA
jgi:hypothetical protein